MHEYREALQAAVQAAEEAGALLREGLTSPGLARRFDLQAEQLIRARLQAANRWSYRSDEAGFLAGQDRSHTWLVDPNDGTFHFNHGMRGSAVAIAALRDGQPVLGVVYAFAFPDHRGDLIAWAEGCGPLTRNREAVSSSLFDVDLDDPEVNFEDRLIVYLSPGADHYPHLAVARCAPGRYITIPSIAYRLALVALGEGVGTLSLNSPCALDYAAGHALLRQAGGVFVDQDGLEIRYTAEGISGCESCFAGGTRVVQALRRRPWTAALTPPPPEPTQPLLRRSRESSARRAPGQVIADPGLLTRAQGCLLGQFVGDALGALVEFRSAQEIHQAYPEKVRHLADGGIWNHLAGQPTDDSELAQLLARTLIREKSYNQAHVLDAYLDWWNDPRTFDRGTTISRALSGAARGKTPEERLRLLEQYANQESQSNGALMRICPVGIFASSRPEAAANLARLDAELTHPHPVCLDANACFAAALAGAIGEGWDANTTHRLALEYSRTSEVRAVLEAAGHASAANDLTQQGWVLVALQNAFYQLLHASSLEEGLVATVMLGGDTDSNAAIAGALLGAVHGRSAIPSRWERCVRSCRSLEGTPTSHPRALEYWPVDVLELAECLLLAGRSLGN